MPSKPTSEMLAVLRDVVLSGGTATLRHLSHCHEQTTMYRCVRRSWLRWVADAGQYEITDAGRVLDDAALTDEHARKGIFVTPAA